MELLTLSTKKRNALVNITTELHALLTKTKIAEGLCIVYCPHTTAAILINENADPSVQEDLLAKLERLVPHEESYSHAEGNADAHIKASVIGNSRTIPINKGKLVLGQWEGVYFAEFDGPRSRNVMVQFIGGGED